MADDFTITRVRPATIPTPHRCAGRLQSGAGHGPAIHYVKDDDRILVDIATSDDHARSMERAGPRELIAWDPAKATAAVLTSGGLCPGLNAVIASIVHSLHYHYGVSRILGVPNGYAGLMTPKQRGIAPLTLERIRGIANTGGSCLGSARIQPNVEMIADTLAAYAVDMLFCIGGDGTQRGAHAIHEEIASRHLETAVVGVPKTIDNDISWVDKTFGFDTAVEIARTAVTAAHTEAEAAINGVGLVKLMGRDSGFIAANAGIASSDANFVLVPEVPFELEGEQGLFASLKRRLADRGHAVIVVAEGAGQELMAPAAAAFDQSGNKLHQDIGLYLKDQRLLQDPRPGDQPQVHRPRLHHPRRAGQRLRRHLLRRPRPPRRPRRPLRPDRHGGGQLERRLHPRPHPAGRPGPEEDRTRRRDLAHGAGDDGAEQPGQPPGSFVRVAW